MKPILLAVLLLSFVGLGRAQNLVLNGNLASPSESGGYADFSVGSTDITDFTVVGADGANVQLLGEGYDNPGYGFGTPAPGDQILQLSAATGSSPGGISQEIATTVGDTYTFTVDYSSRFGDTATGVMYLGTASQDLTSTSQLFITSAGLTFTATSTQTLVEVEQTDSDNLLVIDNLVVIQDASPSVPEPATALPLGVACAGMALFFWRRRTLLAS